MFFVTETGLNIDDYAYLHQPRISGCSGFAVVYRTIFTCSPASFGTFSTFEFLGFVLNGKLRILCVVVYRPPNQNKAFLSEFSELLSVVTSRYDKLFILSDFNIHVCCSANTLATDFFCILLTLLTCNL